MKNLKNILFILVLTALPLLSMETPPQALQQSNILVTLPGELRREILRMSAQKDGVLNIPALADGILALAGTDTTLRRAINTPENMLAILNSLHHKAAALYLADKLAKLPAMQSDAVHAWRKSIKLEKGREMYEAAIRQDMPTLRYYLTLPNIDLNWKNKEHMNRTALAISAVFERMPIVELLLAAGANPNLIDSNGRSSLWEAAYGRNKEITQKLLRAGALVDENIIGWAERREHTDMVKILQKAFAQQQKDKERKSPALQKK